MQHKIACQQTTTSVNDNVKKYKRKKQDYKHPNGSRSSQVCKIYIWWQTQ